EDVLTLLALLEVDRRATGQRGLELSIVVKDLADEPRLVRPDDAHRGVIDLQAHDFRHDDGAPVEREKSLLSPRAIRLCEVGGLEVMDRLRPDEVRRRAPLPIKQVLLEGTGDDQTKGRGDQADDDQAEYPELARQRDVPPPPDQPRHGGIHRKPESRSQMVVMTDAEHPIEPRRE